MITVDKGKKQIRFIPEEGHEDHPPQRSFPLLSAYVCPFCGRILAAYFLGQMAEADIQYYGRQKQRYTFGSVAGGHYIRLENHEGYGYYGDSEKCAWEALTKRGFAENLRLFVKRHELPKMLVQALSQHIKTIPGFHIVEDVCGRDREMLLYSEDELLKGLREKEGWDAYWKAKMNLGDYLAGLVSRMDV